MSAAAAVGDAAYKYMISFRNYTTDERLLRYDEVLQYIYQNILKKNSVNRELTAEMTISALERFSSSGSIKALLEDREQLGVPEKFKSFADSAQILRWLLCKQYERLGYEGWPPEGYPDVPVKDEDNESTTLPPIYKVPGIMTESHLQASIRFLRRISEESINPNIQGKSLQEIYTYMAALKYVLDMKEDARYSSALSSLEDTIQRTTALIAATTIQDDIVRLKGDLTKLEDKKRILNQTHALAELLRKQKYSPELLAIVSADIENMETQLRLSILDNNMKEFNFFKIVLGKENFDNMEITFTDWYNTGKIIGLYAFNISNSSPTRFYTESILPTWKQFLNAFVYKSSYTEAFGNVLYGLMSQPLGRKVKNRNQQVFIGFNANENIDLSTDQLMPHLMKLSDCAWIKFNYNELPQATRIDLGRNATDPTGKRQLKGFEKIIQFQGYRLMDLPPPPILKAFAHGPPLDMASHVKDLFKEWLRPDTLAAWLDKVMAKWRADISRMAADLQQKLCVGGEPNENMWHMRDVPTIQMDLYNDVLEYIAARRGVIVDALRRQYETAAAGMAAPKAVQGGGAVKTKKSAKSKRMTRRNRKQTRRSKQQRGGAATSMPLAYFQDGAQMRGTYDAPTGVGLAGSTNTMARTAIAQIGGRRRSQRGGFPPSIMGPVAQYGMSLLPVASYMGYKMLHGNNRTQRKRRASRRR